MLCVLARHTPLTRMWARSIQREETKRRQDRSGTSLQSSRAQLRWKLLVVRLSCFFEKKGRKTETLGDSTRPLTGRNWEVGREADSDGRTPKMELKSHRAASKGFEEPLSCGPGQSTVTLYPIYRHRCENKDLSWGTCSEFSHQPNFPRNFGQTKMSTPNKKMNKSEGVCWEFKERLFFQLILLRVVAARRQHLFTMVAGKLECCYIRLSSCYVGLHIMLSQMTECLPPIKNLKSNRPLFSCHCW